MGFDPNFITPNTTGGTTTPLHNTTIFNSNPPSGLFSFYGLINPFQAVVNTYRDWILEKEKEEAETLKEYSESRGEIY